MKTTKKRLQELAAINNPFVEPKQENLKESNAKVIPSAAGGDIEMTVTFDNAVKWFLEAAEEMDANIIMDPNDKAQQQRLAETVREDLENWLGNNGAQWLEDGIAQGVYDDFITK